MIIVKFCSGIGNQLYQYAVYLLMKKTYPNAAVKADLSSFRNIEILNGGNGFSYGFGMKEFFGAEIEVATNQEIKETFSGLIFDDWMIKLFPGFVRKYNGVSLLAKIRNKLSAKYGKLEKNNYSNDPMESYNGNILRLCENENYYLNGLWQNYQYIRLVETELREKLILQKVNKEALSAIETKISEENSVCIHVRRGDFTIPRNKYAHDLCGKEYYEKALDIIFRQVENPTLYVFSDDIEYCQEQFKHLENVTYVSALDKITTQEEMWLMGQCKHAIIPNSTFSFWAIWLNYNEDKIVICPRYTVRHKNIWHEFSVPDGWLKVDNL